MTYDDTTSSTFTVTNGEKGDKGDTGNTGPAGEDGFSPTITSSKSGKTTTLTITDVNGTTTATILDGDDSTGDMSKSVYDTDNDGIVDNAEKVNNHTVEADVPSNAVFTDTTYTAGTGISISNGVISNTQTSAEWGNITGTLSNQTDLMTKLGDYVPTTAQDSSEHVTGQIENAGSISITSVDDSDLESAILVADGNTTIYTKDGDDNYYSYADYDTSFSSWQYYDEDTFGSMIRLDNENPNWSTRLDGGNNETSESYIGTDTSKLFASYTYNNQEKGALQIDADGTKLTGVVTPTSNDMAANKGYVDTGLSSKQATLVSGTNIKTINNQSLLGSGDISIQSGGGTWGSITGTLSNQTDLNTALTGKQSKFWEGTKAQYDAITTKDPDTYYAITDDADTTQYQPLLVSGTNIKTLNNTSLLGSGNISIPTDTVSSTTITTITKLTQSQYNALSTKDSNTLYIIVG